MLKQTTTLFSLPNHNYIIALVYQTILLSLCIHYFDSCEIGPHLITGNGVGFKPDILDMDIMEAVLEVVFMLLSCFSNS